MGELPAPFSAAEDVLKSPVPAGVFRGAEATILVLIISASIPVYGTELSAVTSVSDGNARPFIVFKTST